MPSRWPRWPPPWPGPPGSTSPSPKPSPSGTTAGTAPAALRAFNYEHIYLRPASVAQAEGVIAVLQALVEHFSDRPNALTPEGGLAAGSPEAVQAAVTYVAGMTDRVAFQSAVAHLRWDPSRLPVGIDTAGLRRMPRQ